MLRACARAFVGFGRLVKASLVLLDRIQLLYQLRHSARTQASTYCIGELSSGILSVALSVSNLCIRLKVSGRSTNIIARQMWRSESSLYKRLDTKLLVDDLIRPPFARYFKGTHRMQCDSILITYQGLSVSVSLFNMLVGESQWH